MFFQMSKLKLREVKELAEVKSWLELELVSAQICWLQSPWLTSRYYYHLPSWRQQKKIKLTQEAFYEREALSFLIDYQGQGEVN
jgi:hypothetical protein